VRAGALGLPAHVATTRHLCAAYPLVTEAGLGAEGVLVGRDVLGGSFSYDPFVLYRRGIVTNPNMLVFGQIGRGKSAFVKSYLWRQSVFGRRAWVVDPKGEYGALAAAWGVAPIALRPGGAVRLNPLDSGVVTEPLARLSGGARNAAATGEGGGSGRVAGEGGGGSRDSADPGDDAWRRRVELVASLAVASLGRDLLPRERAAADAAVGLATARAGGGAPTLPAVVGALFDPAPEAAAALRTDVATLAEDGRDVALELRRLVHGDLAGMFDGETTPGLSLDAPLVVLDLSAVYGSPALGALMACAAAWLQHSVRAAGPSHLLLVVDEAWAILANVGVARWLQASWKLSRAAGVSNVAVLHRLSDLRAVGAAASEQVRLAEGLLADSETRVLYAQPPSEVAASGELLGLTATEADLCAELQRGVALWKVGRRSFLVEHQLATSERALVDTDAAMGDPVPGGPAGPGR
jgi:hypothetical protein